MSVRLERSRRRGSSLVLVLILGAFLAAIALAALQTAVTSRSFESTTGESRELTYACESAAELLRLELTRDWETSGFTPTLWMQQRVRKTSATGPDAPRNDQTTPGTPGDPRGYPRTFAAFPGVAVWVDRVGAPGSNWVEVVASTDASVGATKQDARTKQSIRLRFAWGNNPIFDLAMLTVQTNCMFCHMKIQGDVGSINFFRAGWGSHPDGGGTATNGWTGSAADLAGDESGLDSFITGSIYTPANDIDMNRVNNINGGPNDGSRGGVMPTWNSGAGKVNFNYTGAKLPKDTDGDGKADFPAIDPVLARSASKGTIWAGNPSNNNNATDGGVWVVPLNGSFSSATTPGKSDFQSGSGAAAGLVNTTGSVINGNLVLVGTDSHPIELNGDVFVEGDVVIKGPVKGKGAIYAGRNMYIAGDVTHATGFSPASWATGGGLPPGSGPLANDTGAQSSITGEPNATELRLASRQNIILGDWTYMNDAETAANQMKYRQGQDFMKAQFGLDQTRYFDDTKGGELKPFDHDNDGNLDENSDGRPDYFRSDQGETVADSTSRVLKVAPNAANNVGSVSTFDREVYDAVVSPGRITSPSSGTGDFQPWMSQAEYRAILGTKNYDGMVWRAGIGSDDAKLNAELGAPPADPDFWGSTNKWSEMVNNSNGKAWFEKDKFGTGKGQFVFEDNGTFRVIETGTKPWPKQVERIDAFLYANGRIGGVNLGAGLTINGGMAATEIGILAPGVTDSNGWWKSSGNIPSNCDDKSSYVNPWASVGSDDPRNRLFLNYDFRLRNGGYGYNLVKGGAGDALVYQVAGPRTAP